MDAENKKGIGLAALVAIIVSGAIGGGVFNLSNDLATNASPGGVVISWIVIGFGILMLVLSLNHLAKQEEASVDEDSEFYKKKPSLTKGSSSFSPSHN